MDNIFKIFQQMMDDRNYISQSPISPKTNITIDDFDISFLNPVTNVYFKVFYIPNQKIGINHIKDILKQLDDLEYKSGILIYTSVITSFAKQFLDSSKYHIQCFSENELEKNIYKHCLVPKHKLLTPTEKTTFLKGMNLKSQNLPKIKLVDPISKYFGAIQGDVFEITRNDDGFPTMYYRLCI